VILPGISGIEVVEAASRLAPELATMLMTGYSNAPINPGVPLLEKPFTPKELLSRVRKVLELSDVTRRKA